MNAISQNNSTGRTKESPRKQDSIVMTSVEEGYFLHRAELLSPEDSPNLLLPRELTIGLISKDRLEPEVKLPEFVCCAHANYLTGSGKPGDLPIFQVVVPNRYERARSLMCRPTESQIDEVISKLGLKLGVIFAIQHLPSE